MTASAHAIIGAAIVTKIPDLRISLPLVLLSHILADIPEHWDTGCNWQNKGMKKVFWDSVLDLIVGYSLIALIFIWGLKADPVMTYLGAFVGQLPDFLEFPYFFLHWKFAPWTWINDMAHLFHKKLPQINLGILSQIIICSLFILLAAIK